MCKPRLRRSDAHQTDSDITLLHAAVTCIIYFGYNIFLPLMPFIHYGEFLYGFFMVKIELLLQFAMCVLWLSGALAYAVDLRGRENCLFDGYYHYTKPSDFNHVCDLINWAVPLAYATFGIQVLLWFFETAFGLYTFLLLDQDSLNEPHFSWGRRAYDWKYSLRSGQRGSTGSGNSYRARAVATGGGAAAGAGAAGVKGSRLSPNGRGRRGAAYNDPEAIMEDQRSELPKRDDSDSELAEEMTESEHSRSPLALGRRGRRGYADQESVVSASDSRRSDGHAESESWHLRD